MGQSGAKPRHTTTQEKWGEEEMSERAVQKWQLRSTWGEYEDSQSGKKREGPCANVRK